MTNHPQQAPPRLILGLIIVGLLLWALYIAVGAYFYNQNPWRGVIVMASMGLFVGFWLILLRGQKRNQNP